MPNYHEFVFDTTNRRFVGMFEEMYRAESDCNFDSWHQDDLSARYDVTVMLRLLAKRHYRNALDLGCGKGSLTSILASFADHVHGVDISKTAVDVATRRFPGLEFSVMEISSVSSIRSALDSVSTNSDGRVLVVICQVLSYLENWREIIRCITRSGADILVALYLPDNPIGFVKSFQELRDELTTSDGLLTHIYNQEIEQHIFFVTHSGQVRV
ncbi:MAG: class I SAM-dependent DNA methyltransferase [Actinomycetota bacterium]